MHTRIATPPYLGRMYARTYYTSFIAAGLTEADRGPLGPGSVSIHWSKIKLRVYRN